MTADPLDPQPIGEERRSALLSLAREALTVWFTSGDSSPRVAADPDLSKEAGVFVTLRRGGRLRGCIGLVEPPAPLAEAVWRCAISAANDPRFPPLSRSEMSEVRIEISVLGPRRAVGGPGEVEAGLDGVIVSRGWRKGLLLPQVAREQGWDSARLLSEASLKAGLPSDAWRTGAVVEAFRAEVFGEAEPGPGAGEPT